MKKGVLAAFCCVLAFTAHAQQRGAVRGPDSPGRTYGSWHGFGNVLFPGTGSAPSVQRSPFSITDPGFARSLSMTVSGFPPYTGVQKGRSPRTQPQRTVVIPYAYPVYVGAYADPYYQQPQTPSVMVVYPPPQQVPPFVVNQTPPPKPARPVLQEYGRHYWSESQSRVYQAPSRSLEDAVPSEEEPAIFLIVFKDHSIYSAAAYWVEDDTLHYVTTYGKQNKASLELVDREMSERLNRERNVAFRLPPAD